MVKFILFFRSLQMVSFIPANLVENSTNIPLAIGEEHLTFSAHKDKYLCLVEGCRSKGYVAKNHFCKHVLLHSLLVAWDNPERSKK